MFDSPISVPICRLAGNRDLPLPAYHSEKAAGMDLQAAVQENVVIQVGQCAMVSNGFPVATPDGFEGQIRPRSGLAAKFGITVANAPGTVDADYRGELLVTLINHGSGAFVITRGMRIANFWLFRFPEQSGSRPMCCRRHLGVPAGSGILECRPRSREMDNTMAFRLPRFSQQYASDIAQRAVALPIFWFLLYALLRFHSFNHSANRRCITISRVFWQLGECAVHQSIVEVNQGLAWIPG